MLCSLHSVQSEYDKELKCTHSKHLILFSSNGVFICILFNLMKMEMNSLAHPVIALFQQQRRLGQGDPFPRSHQGKLSACLLVVFRLFSETNQYFSKAFLTLAAALKERSHCLKHRSHSSEQLGVLDHVLGQSTSEGGGSTLPLHHLTPKLGFAEGKSNPGRH